MLDSALANVNFTIEKLGYTEKQAMIEDLEAACQFNLFEAPNKTFYKVDFIDAIELIRRGSVHLKKGFAYFPFDDLVTILVTKMKNNMMAAMAVRRKSIFREEN